MIRAEGRKVVINMTAAEAEENLAERIADAEGDYERAWKVDAVAIDATTINQVGCVDDSPQGYVYAYEFDAVAEILEEVD